MKRLLLVVVLGLALPAAAQYPNRNVTMLAGYPAGGLVDISRSRAPRGAADETPPGPSTTSSTASGDGRDVMTTSAPSAASAGVPAMRVPSASARRGSRSHAVTS